MIWISGGREEYHDWFKNEYDQIVEKLYSFSDKFQPTMENLQHVKNGSQSMLLNRFYVLSNPMRNQIYGVSGNVFTNPIEMIAERGIFTIKTTTTRKFNKKNANFFSGFLLLRKFDKILSFMKDSGLMDKINKDFIFNMTILNNIHNRAIGDLDEDAQIVLTINHLEGAWAVLIVGLSISALVFLMELISVAKWFQLFIRKLRKFWIKLLIFLKLYEIKKEKPVKAKKSLAKQIYVAQSYPFEYID